MKTDLAYLIETISQIDGRITISDLPLAKIEGLRHRIVWAYSDRRALNASYAFGGKKFRPQGTLKSLTIDTGSPQYDYEVKAVMLLLFHSEQKEGGVPYKWQSVLLRARTLAKFAGYCTRHGLRSFRNISEIPALKFRNLLLGFITDSVSKGGMDARIATSSYKTVRNALKHLAGYGLVERPDFSELMDELTLAKIEKHEKENRLRHAIIPTGVMKRVIAEAASYIEQAEVIFDEFATVFRQSNQAIVAAKCKNPRYAVFSTVS